MVTEERHLSPREAAALLLWILQRRGGVVALSPDGNLLCDLEAPIRRCLPQRTT
jgi:hypothetical protein